VDIIAIFVIIIGFVALPFIVFIGVCFRGFSPLPAVFLAVG
jgi:hypothetical protein